jgi:hypothetical protein
MRPSEISRPSGVQGVYGSPRQDQRAAALALETGVVTSALSGELLEMRTFGEPPKVTSGAMSQRSISVSAPPLPHILHANNHKLSRRISSLLTLHS